MLTAALIIGAFAYSTFAQDSTSTVPMVTVPTTSSSLPMTTLTHVNSVGGGVQTTITGLVGSLTSGYAASVVTADPCETVLAMACTATEIGVCARASNVVLTVTQGPYNYQYSYGTSTLGGYGQLAESCDLSGPAGSPTKVVCTATLSVSAEGTSTSTTAVSTLNSAAFNVGPIPVTAGASKLPSSGASCTSTPNAAAATGVSGVYKVIVPVLVAGAGALI